MSVWKTWDEQEKASAIRIAGLIMAGLAIFTFISTFSYLFHWKEDMSMDEIANAAGIMGYRTGKLLVGELFGLGSFALLILFSAISARLIGHRWHYSLRRFFKSPFRALMLLCPLLISSSKTAICSL